MNENRTESSHGQLSFWALAAVITGSTIGSGIFTITADMASEERTQVQS